jgi:K(+)-stimulated pyrophosphate-energized sodium pump
VRRPVFISEGHRLTDFLTDYGIVIALGCAGAAVLYGLITSRWLLAKSPGNQEMQPASSG